MTGITNLTTLLQTMKPELATTEFVFCTVADELSRYLNLEPIATFHEKEGLTLVLEKHQAQQASLPFEGVFLKITLSVHSSLEAVGLTAAVSAQLTKYGISANVIAAYYHDHIFVPKEKATQAMVALKELSNDA